MIVPKGGGSRDYNCPLEGEGSGETEEQAESVKLVYFIPMYTISLPVTRPNVLGGDVRISNGPWGYG